MPHNRSQPMVICICNGVVRMKRGLIGIPTELRPRVMSYSIFIHIFRWDHRCWVRHGRLYLLTTTASMPPKRTNKFTRARRHFHFVRWTYVHAEYSSNMHACMRVYCLFFSFVARSIQRLCSKSDMCECVCARGDTNAIIFPVRLIQTQTSERIAEAK